MGRKVPIIKKKCKEMCQIRLTLTIYLTEQLYVAFNYSQQLSAKQRLRLLTFKEIHMLI